MAISEQGQDVLSGAISEALEVHGMTPQEIRQVVDEELTGVMTVPVSSPPTVRGDH